MSLPFPPQRADLPLFPSSFFSSLVQSQGILLDELLLEEELELLEEELELLEEEEEEELELLEEELLLEDELGALDCELLDGPRWLLDEPSELLEGSR